MLPPKSFIQMCLCNPNRMISLLISSKHGETVIEIYHQRFNVSYLHISGL